LNIAVKKLDKLKDTTLKFGSKETNSEVLDNLLLLLLIRIWLIKSH